MHFNFLKILYLKKLFKDICLSLFLDRKPQSTFILFLQYERLNGIKKSMSVKASLISFIDWVIQTEGGIVAIFSVSLSSCVIPGQDKVALLEKS